MIMNVNDKELRTLSNAVIDGAMAPSISKHYPEILNCVQPAITRSVQSMLGRTD
jgi:hypothetical protein